MVEKQPTPGIGTRQSPTSRMIEVRTRTYSTLRSRGEGATGAARRRGGAGATLILRNEAHLHLNKVLGGREAAGRGGTNYTNYTKSSLGRCPPPPLALTPSPSPSLPEQLLLCPDMGG